MAELTKKLLANSLHSLMINKPLNKITIQQIVDQCDLNRQTFYYHFQDIYDLLLWMFQSETDEILKDIPVTADNWTDILYKVLTYIESNKEVCMCAINSVQYKAFTKFLYIDVEPAMKELISSVVDGSVKVDEYYTNFLTHFLTISIASIIIDWVTESRKDIRITPRELTKLIDITVSGTLLPAFERYNREKENN